MDFIEIGTLFSSDKHFIIPDYQREYSWDKDKNETLWSDIADLIAGEKKKRHFLGAIVTAPYRKEDSYLATINPESYYLDSNEVYHLLDGQQRLTSLSLLIAAIHSACQSDQLLADHQKQLISQPLQTMLFDKSNTDDNESPSPRLFLKEESGKYFFKNILHISVSGSPDSRYKSIRLMREAYELYLNKVRCWIDENASDDRFNAYDKLISILSNRVQVVDVRCNKNMNEFQVFESLNGKGQNLTAVDRIKSMYLSNARQSQTNGATRWQALYSKFNCKDNLLLHFFTTFFFYKKERRVSKIDLPNSFREMSKTDYQSFAALDSDLQEAADRYCNLRYARTGFKQLDDLLNEIAQLEQDQVYVPLYAAAVVYRSDYAALAKICECLLTYSVRYTICGKAKNLLDSDFTKMISSMKKECLESTCELIVNKTESDDDFQRAFSRFATKNASLAKYLLDKIERRHRIAVGNGNPLPDSYTLEHIIPQAINYTNWYGPNNEPDKAEQDSYYDDIICSIGNMILINRNDNSAANNRNYQIKTQVYRNGSTKVGSYGKPADTYQLVKELLASYPDEFTSAQVLERASALSNEVTEIWPLH